MCLPHFNQMAESEVGGFLDAIGAAEVVRDLVTRLTDLHESERADSWAVTDAPATYIDKERERDAAVARLMSDLDQA